jgi:aldehyde dehydrogenase (NAD+)
VLDQFTRWQAMNWDYSGHLQKAQMDIAELAADSGFRPACQLEWRGRLR